MNKNGFSLIELLITLSIFSILLVLIVPQQSHSLDRQVEQRFMEQLEQDVLFIQNQTALTNRQQLKIKFYDNYYQIYNRIHPASPRRSYPTDWIMTHASDPIIYFTTDGTLPQPQTIDLQSDTERISLVFPFGKGRFYFETKKRVFDD